MISKKRYENQANKFTAGLLINEKELDRHLLEYTNVDQLASYFGVPRELVEYKFKKNRKL